MVSVAVLLRFHGYSLSIMSRRHYLATDPLVLATFLLPLPQFSLSLGSKCGLQVLPIGTWSTFTYSLCFDHLGISVSLNMLHKEASRKLEINILLLKIPHSSDTGLGGIEQELTWSPLPQGLALIVSEDAMQAVKREEQPRVLCSYKA